MSTGIRLIENQDEIINEIRHLNYSSTRLSVCSGFGGMQMGYKYLFDSYMNIVEVAILSQERIHAFLTAVGIATAITVIMTSTIGKKSKCS